MTKKRKIVSFETSWGKVSFPATKKPKDEDSAGIGSSGYLTDGKREVSTPKVASCPSNPVPSMSKDEQEFEEMEKEWGEEKADIVELLTHDCQKCKESRNDICEQDDLTIQNEEIRFWKTKVRDLLAARSKQIEAMISRTSNPAVLVFLRKEMERVR